MFIAICIKKTTCLRRPVALQICNFIAKHFLLHVKKTNMITFFFSVVLSIGVKESSILNNIFTAVNLLVVAYVVICGFFKLNFKNWSIPSDEV